MARGINEAVNGFRRLSKLQTLLCLDDHTVPLMLATPLQLLEKSRISVAHGVRGRRTR